MHNGQTSQSGAAMKLHTMALREHAAQQAMGVCYTSSSAFCRFRATRPRWYRLIGCSGSRSSTPHVSITFTVHGGDRANEVLVDLVRGLSSLLSNRRCPACASKLSLGMKRPSRSMQVKPRQHNSSRGADGLPGTHGTEVGGEKPYMSWYSSVQCEP